MGMHKIASLMRCMALALVFSAVWGALAIAADIQRITKEELRGLLDNPEVTVLDVRSEKDWKASSLKIKGALWEDFLEAETWAKKYPKERKLVLYCA